MGQAIYNLFEAAFTEAKFAIGAVIAFLTATSFGLSYMLASHQELETLYEGMEQYYDAV